MTSRVGLGHMAGDVPKREMEGSEHMIAGQQQVFFPTGSVLFHEGDEAKGAYFILTGQLTTTMESTAKGPLPLGSVYPPAYVALVDSLSGGKYSCTTRAAHDTRGVFIPREKLLSMMSTQGDNLTLLKALADEVSGSYEELRNVRDKYCGRSAARKHDAGALPG